MPLSALFIIFDLVVHNPTHPETNNNLALLDVASGHFSRIEYASRGTLPGSLVAEFAHIARQYVRDVQQGEHNRNNDNHNNNNSDGNVPIKNNTTEASSNAKDIQGQIQSLKDVQPQSQSQDQLPNNLIFQATTTTTAAAASPPLTPTPQSAWQSNHNHQVLGESLPQQQQQAQQQYNSSNTSGNSNLMDDGTRTGTESLFFPLVDDPNYMPEALQLLGIDVMDLFDSVNPAAAAGGIQN